MNKSAKQNNKITVVGSINCDLTAYVNTFPETNQTIIAQGSSLAIGGKGLNQAVAAANAGAEVSMVACVGDDSFGKMSLEYLKKNSVKTENISILAGEKTGTANIFVSDKGENMIAVSSGANALLTPLDLAAADNAITDADVVIVQLETPLKTVESTLLIAKNNNIFSILNPAPALEECVSLLPLVDLITPNETETMVLTGIYPSCQDSVKRAALILQEQGANAVIITLGEKGCFVMNREDAKLIPPFNVEAVDPTGAGDVFNGVLASSLTKGIDLFESAKIASAAAAISVTKKTAEGAAPSALEISEFIEIHNK